MVCLFIRVCQIKKYFLYIGILQATTLLLERYLMEKYYPHMK